jgi:hypothetical protein
MPEAFTDTAKTSCMTMSRLQPDQLTAIPTPKELRRCGIADGELAQSKGSGGLAECPTRAKRRA